jgi:prepilin-type N-terminal cleavage/methylation domain-containing protein
MDRIKIGKAFKYYRSFVRNNKGVTLIEVLVAAVVLTVGLLGVAMMQYAAITGNAFGKEMQTATSLCQEVLEMVNATPVTDPNGNPVPVIVTAGNHPTGNDIDPNSPNFGSASLANPVHGGSATQTGGVTFTRVWWVVDNCRDLAVNDPDPNVPLCNPMPASNCINASNNMKAIAVRTCWTDKNAGNHAVTLHGEKWNTNLSW